MRIWTEEGLRGFYRGMLPAFVGVSHGALQFMAYEEMKKTWITFHPGMTMQEMVPCVSEVLSGE